jgi:hypothetical protein
LCCSPAVCACYHNHDGFPGSQAMLTLASAWQHDLD